MKYLFQLFLIMTFGGCANASQKNVNTDFTTFDGVLFFGEYSYFRDKNRNIYSLSLSEQRTNSRVSEITKEFKGQGPLCIEMKFKGYISNEKDAMDRSILHVIESSLIERIKC